MVRVSLGLQLKRRRTVSCCNGGMRRMMEEQVEERAWYVRDFLVMIPMVILVCCFRVAG